MSWTPPWQRRRTPVPAKKPQPPPPIPAALQAEFDAKPFLGTHGEMLPRLAVAAPAAQPVGLVIEPPDWAEEERILREQTAGQPQTPAMRPVEAMMARAAELGELDEPPAIGPPAHFEPLQRFVPPPVDWRAEEAATRRREQAEKARIAAEARRALLEQLLAEDTERYPRKAKP